MGSGTVTNSDLDFKIQYNSIEYELCINFMNSSPKQVNEVVRFNFNIFNNDEKVYENSLLLTNNDWQVTAEFEQEEQYADLEYFVPKSLILLMII